MTMGELRSLIQLYTGRRIPGLWKFSRQIAGKHDIKLNSVMKHSPSKGYLEVDLTSPRKMRTFLRKEIRSSGKAKAFLEATSAVFGLDSGDDDERQEGSRKLLINLMNDPIKGPQYFQELLEIIPKYPAWTASGKHRFAPLALAVVNMFQGRNIFDGGPIEQVIQADSDLKYLSEMYPYYAKPNNVPARYVPSYLPELQLPMPPEKDIYSWLDIGSAPKTGGAPTLNALRSAFHKCLPDLNFEFHGTDLAMPVFELTAEGKIERSKYFDNRTGWIKPRTEVNGANYYDASLPEYNVMNDGFFGKKKFDFISACMVMHHLIDPPVPSGAGLPRMPLSSLNILDMNGENIRDKTKIYMAASQQQVVDRLLGKLEVGGMLFLNAYICPLVNQTDDDYINEDNTDMFFIILRSAENKFVLYDEHPIPFRPNGDAFTPFGEQHFMDGHKHPLSYFDHSGIRSVYPGISNEKKLEIENLFARADLLAFRYQGWKKGVWGSAGNAISEIKKRSPLQEILRAYLRNVPEDDALKQELLADAERTVGKFQAIR